MARFDTRDDGGNVARTVKTPHARVVIAVAYIACFASGSASARDVLPLTCDARATISAVEKMALLGGDGVAVKLLAPAQAGVAAAEGQRGCVGTLIVDRERIAHAWVIAPDPQHPDRPIFKAGNRAIVEERFSHIDAAGRFSNTAAPLGRAVLAQALRAGVTRMRAPYTDALKSNKRLEGGTAEDMADIDNARALEIADIEPLGACRPAPLAGSYVCSVLFEHNDPLAEELHIGGATIVRADFTFAPVSGQARWRVGPQFASEFGRAVRANQLATGKKAAAEFLRSHGLTIGK